jgi:hypothetical protein
MKLISMRTYVNFNYFFCVIFFFNCQFINVFYFIKVIILLDVSPSQEMLDEGVLRDIVNRVQRLRKEYKIVPTDDITVYYKVTPSDSKLDELLKRSLEYLETNIKKPFKAHSDELNIQVKAKSFDVRFIF